MSVVSEDKSGMTNKKTGLFVLLATGLIARLAGAFIYPGYQNDMNCFIGWSDHMFQNGPGGFYTDEMFTDYPPVYMYVLWLIGAVRNIIPMSDMATTLILKLPAIICDLLIGALLYNLANRKIGKYSAYFVTVLWLFNPAVFINASLWGQVDSVFTILVFIVLLLVTEKKLIPSFFIFGVAVMLKPQSLFYTPILLLAVAEETIYPVFKPKELLKYVGFGVLAILFALAICVPFGLSNVINQYIGTLSSYQYGSVNAYNMWAAFGFNWANLTPVMSFIGTTMIVAVVIAAALFFFNIKSESKYFWLGGFICFGVFVLAVKMHERYAYPVMLLLLAGFVLDSKSKQKMWLYLAVTATQIINTGYVLFIVLDGKSLAQNEKATASVVGFITLGVFVWLLYATIQMCTRKTREKILAEGVYKVRQAEGVYKVRRKDVIAMIALTAVYSAIALFNLGDMCAPETKVIIENETKTFALEKNKGIQGLRFYLGEYHLDQNNTLKMELLNESGESVYEKEFNTGSVFCWAEQEFNLPPASELVLSTTGKVSIFEMAFIDKKGNFIDGEGALFDEPDKVPVMRTFRNSTYFDEIYHGRTAYEFLEGDNVYEWTHPPLGKVIISIGVKLFGMNPFGWRIMGTLFGIFMVPVMYIFAIKLFGKSHLALFTATVFAFDFMHFTQTRIATIDVYITFFIMLMYMFMVSYLREDFYGDIKKLLVPLGLCGLSFGLGVASKWTGAYAGAGLAVMFFANLFVRYREYKNGSPEAIIFPKRVKTLILFCVGAFVVIPLIIYILSYIPYLRTEGVGIEGIWENQLAMYNYHSKLVAEHSFSSPWYQWPIIYRPVWYYSAELSDTMRGGISAMGNPLVWWTGIPAFFYTAYFSIRNKDKTAIFLSISYLAQLLPWVLVTRITFIYHYFPSVPFVVLMIAYSANKLFGDSKKAIVGMAVYVVAVIALFAMFYPVLSGYPVSMDYVRNCLKWFSQWYFVSGV